MSGVRYYDGLKQRLISWLCRKFDLIPRESARDFACKIAAADRVLDSGERVHNEVISDSKIVVIGDHVSITDGVFKGSHIDIAPWSRRLLISGNIFLKADAA